MLDEILSKELAELKFVSSFRGVQKVFQKIQRYFHCSPAGKKYYLEFIDLNIFQIPPQSKIQSEHSKLPESIKEGYLARFYKLNVDGK